MVEIAFDAVTMGIFVTMVGIVIAFYFSVMQERRTRREEKKQEMMRQKVEKDEFAKKVDTAIEKGVAAVKEKITGFEKRFDDFKTYNRDEVVDIKKRLEKLFQELEELDKTKGDRVDVDERIEKLRNEIEMIQKRVAEIESRLPNVHEINRQ